jgi:anti-sigma B factor antagonist
MSKPAFRSELSSPRDGVAVFTLSGRLYGYQPCWDFLEELRESAEKSKGVVLDLGGVEYADSTGVGILASAYTSVTNAGGKFILTCLNDRVRTILDVLWFLKRVDHTDTVEEALVALGAGESG